VGAIVKPLEAIGQFRAALPVRDWATSNANGSVYRAMRSRPASHRIEADGADQLDSDFFPSLVGRIHQARPNLDRRALRLAAPP